MQHNWWLATLEHLGLLTREEAEHLSKEIKTRIHKDTYADTFNEVSSVLMSGHILERIAKFKTLRHDLDVIKTKVGALETKVVDSKPKKAA